MIDLTILLDTSVEGPAEMLEAAIDRGVDIVAGCIFPRLGGRVAHLAVRPDDVALVRRLVAERGGAVVDERECVVVRAGHPGGARAIARRLSDAGIVINLSYFGSRGEVVFGTSDIGGTRRVLDDIQLG